MKTLKRTGIAFLTAFSLVTIPSVVKASDWSLMAESEIGSKYFIDLDSITRSGTIAKASTFTVYGETTSRLGREWSYHS